jgi:Ca2+:H+ antiporter
MAEPHSNLPDQGFQSITQSDTEAHGNGSGNGKAGILPTHNEKRRSLGLLRVNTAGESGRRGIHPLKFVNICFRSTSKVSMVVNVLWPFLNY